MKHSLILSVSVAILAALTALAAPPLYNPLMQEDEGEPVVAFYGTNALIFSFPTPDEMTGTENWTTEIVVNNPVAELGEETIVAYASRPTHTVQLGYGNSTTYGAFGTYYDVGGVLGWNPLPATGVWHHLAYSLVGGPGGRMQVFADGVLNNFHDPSDHNTKRREQLVLGRCFDSSGAVWSPHSFSGLVKSIRIYDYILSSNQIVYLNDPGEGEAPPRGPIIWVDAADLPYSAGEEVVTWPNKGSRGGVFGFYDTTTYYIGPNGNDVNAGTTPATAFKTFDKAMETVVEGDTIRVLEGVYTNPFTKANNNTNELPTMYFGMKQDGSFVDNLTMEGDGPTKTIFRYVPVGDGKNVENTRRIFVSGHYNTLSGLKLEGAFTGDSDYAYAMYLVNASNTFIDNIWVAFPPEARGWAGVGTSWSDSVKDCTIQYCLVDGGGLGVRDRHWDGWADGKFSHSLTILNCTFVNQKYGPRAEEAIGVSIQNNTDTEIKNCIFQDCESNAVYVTTSAGYSSSITTVVDTVNCLWYQCGQGFLSQKGANIQVNQTTVEEKDPQLETSYGYDYCSPWGGVGWHGRAFESPVILNTVAWPLVGNNIQREGNALVNGIQADAMLIWTNLMQIGPSGSGIWGSPVTDESAVYIPVDSYNIDGYTFLALNINDGSLKFGAYLNDWCNGSPCVSEKMVLTGDNSGTINAIDKSNGLFIWQSKAGTSINGDLILNDNKVYAECDNLGVVCLNAEDGTILWTNEHPNASTWSGSGPAMNATGSRLYYKTESGSIRAVNTADGSTAWTYAGLSGRGNQEPIVDDDGNIYCGLNGLSNLATQVLLKLNSDGEEVWHYDIVDWGGHGGYCLSIDNSIVYVSYNSGLLALDADTGALNWLSPDVGAAPGGCAVSQDGIVYCVANQAGGASLVAVQDNDTASTLLWEIPIGTTGSSISFPCILPNGDVVVATDGGAIARVGVPEPGMLGLLAVGLFALIRRKR